MLGKSLEPRKMSGYELYFEDFKRIYLGYDYDLE